MQFWFARGSEIPVRQQLVTQVVLGILCNDLAPGQRLPSTRELARRFRIHPNTISAAYRQLHQEKWVELRRGSGVYVRAPRAGAAAGSNAETLIAGLVLASRRAGLPLPELRRLLERWLRMQPPSYFQLIEPDEQLRNIALAELQESARLPVHGCGFSEARSADPSTAIWLVFPSKEAPAREILGPQAELLVLQVRSAPGSMAQSLPKSRDWLVGVASGWPGFLDTARTMLMAAGFHADSLVIRGTGASGWRKDLECTAGILCDLLTAPMLPAGKLAIVFRIVSDQSLAEVRRWEEFLLPRPAASTEPGTVEKVSHSRNHA